VDAPPEPSVDERLDAAFTRLLRQMHERFHVHLREHDLTPPQAIALRHLAEGSVAMGAMADRLHCDASNMTGIADRLEERGLAERRPDPDDRRVKRLAITPDGARIYARLNRSFWSELPGAAALSATDRARLASLLERLFAGEPGADR
jgi:DNA-binding MarR family transcriptional regulator